MDVGFWSSGSAKYEARAVAHVRLSALGVTRYSLEQRRPELQRMKRELVEVGRGGYGLDRAMRR